MVGFRKSVTETKQHRTIRDLGLVVSALQRDENDYDISGVPTLSLSIVYGSAKRDYPWTTLTDVSKVCRRYKHFEIRNTGISYSENQDGRWRQQITFRSTRTHLRS